MSDFPRELPRRIVGLWCPCALGGSDQTLSARALSSRHKSCPCLTLANLIHETLLWDRAAQFPGDIVVISRALAVGAVLRAITLDLREET